MVTRRTLDLNRIRELLQRRRREILSANEGRTASSPP